MHFNRTQLYLSERGKDGGLVWFPVFNPKLSKLPIELSCTKNLCHTMLVSFYAAFHEKTNKLLFLKSINMIDRMPFLFLWWHSGVSETFNVDATDLQGNRPQGMKLLSFCTLWDKYYIMSRKKQPDLINTTLICTY